MSPEVLLARLGSVGVLLDVQGDDLRYRGPRGALTPELRRAIQENKAAILGAWRSAFEERASVMEFEACLPREEAERHAREDVTMSLGTVTVPADSH